MSTYNNYGSPSPGPGPGNSGPYRNNNNKNNEDFIETLSWIIDIGMIFVWFPVGLFLTIANANGHNFVGSIIRSLKKSFGGSGTTSTEGTRYYDVGQNRTTSSRVDPSQVRTTSSRVRADQRVKVETDAASEKEKKASDGIRHIDAGAKVKEVFGWIVAALGILGTIGSMGDGIWAILSGVAVILGGAALLWSGRKAKRAEAAFKRCITVSGDKGIVKIAGLAKTLGMKQEDLEKQLEEMIDRGYYGERAYIDHARGLLVIEPEQMRDVYKAEDEAKAAGKTAERVAEEMTARSEYEKILAQIEQADEDIADEVMSEKIRTMRELTAAIFQEVEAHPAKKPQIQRFMNYYLPTTLKLLDSYARIEEQGVSGDNMAKAKADIERIADTLVEGYRKQLDTLYQSEAVDIAGDVSVIESMMRRDGLTGQNDFRIHAPKTESASASAEKPQTAAGGEGQVMGGH